MNDDVIQLIVSENNGIAAQYLATTPNSRRPMVKFWLDFIPNEIRTFLAILNIIMGMNPCTKQRLYWLANHIFKDGIIRNVLTIDLLEMIFKFLHFRSNTNVIPLEDLWVRSTLVMSNISG